jgi:hypothetical protein
MSDKVVGVFSSILAFIGDAPWKALFIVVLLVICGVGWVAYEKRDEIVEAWLTPSAPKLKTDLIPEAMTKLSTETSADIVQIWAVDLASNSQWFLAARRHDGERPVIPAPRRLPIIVHTSDVRALIDVLEGHPTCVDLEKTGSPLARRLADRGMKRGCAIPIPPNPESFLGVIYLSWATPLDESAENVAVGAAREVANTLVTR